VRHVAGSGGFEQLYFGEAVELQTSGTNNAFLIQPITIPAGVTLLVDGGVTVFASRNPADYQVSGAETCGTVGTAGNGCSPLFNIAKNATSSGAGIMGME
jgi:polygalacturonase